MIFQQQNSSSNLALAGVFVSNSLLRSDWTFLVVENGRRYNGKKAATLSTSKPVDISGKIQQ